METQSTVHHKNVHNKFKLNGFHLDREDLCRVAYSFIKEGEAFEKPVGEFLIDWFDDKPYLEMTTSGTTGDPKVIKISKQSMVNSALATGDFFEIKPGDRALACLPVRYVAGKMMFIRAFVLGLDMDFVAPSSHPLKGTEGVYDFVAMVPMQAQYSLEELNRVKKLIVGGAKITKPLVNALKSLPIEVFETYGMTETVSHIAARKIGEESFTVFPNIKIAQNDLQCLEVEAPHLIEEKLITNDLIELVDENHFKWLGRVDNIINSGGIKLIPEQIEEKLATKIPRRYFVAGQPDPILGEKLVMMVEGEPFTIENEIFESLDKYEKPKEIHFVKHFEETATGKIMRKDTLQKFAF